MSFFGGLAQGLQAGMPLGQAYADAKERKRRSSVLAEYGPGAFKGDQGALSKIAGVDPGLALGLGSGAMALQQQRRMNQMQGIAAGLAYFHDANTPQAFEAAKTAWMKTPYADLVPEDQLTFQNKDRLMQMAVSYTKDMAPWEIDAARAAASQARIERDRAMAEMTGVANAQIGAARGRMPQQGGQSGFYDWLDSNEAGPDGYSARNPLSSASGRGQFMQKEWNEFRKANPAAASYATMADAPPQVQDGAIGWLANKKGAALESMGIEPTDSNLALAWRYGEGMVNPLRRANPNARAADVFRENARMYGGQGMVDKVISGNRIGNKTVGQVLSEFDAIGAGQGRDIQAERARDGLVQANPALGAYAPQGEISAEAGAYMQPPAPEAAEPTTTVRNAEAYADAVADRGTQAWNDAYASKLAPSERQKRIFGPNGQLVYEEGNGLGDFGTATQNDIDKKVVAMSDQLARAQEVVQNFDPTMQETLPRLENAFYQFKDRLGEASPQERALIERFAEHRSRAGDQLNQLIKEMAGSAVSDSEAARILQTMPNPGTGVFDGDSPAEFKRKAEVVVGRLDRAMRRYQTWRQQGGRGNPWEVASIFDEGQQPAQPPAPQGPAPAPQATIGPSPDAMPENSPMFLRNQGYEDQNVGGVTISAAEQYEFDQLVKGGISEHEAFQRVHEKYGGGQ